MLLWIYSFRNADVVLPPQIVFGSIKRLLNWAQVLYKHTLYSQHFIFYKYFGHNIFEEVRVQIDLCHLAQESN
jgi:hypothetical protein